MSRRRDSCAGQHGEGTTVVCFGSAGTRTDDKRRGPSISKGNHTCFRDFRVSAAQFVFGTRDGQPNLDFIPKEHKVSSGQESDATASLPMSQVGFTPLKPGS